MRSYLSDRPVGQDQKVGNRTTFWQETQYSGLLAPQLLETHRGSLLNGVALVFLDEKDQQQFKGSMLARCPRVRNQARGRWKARRLLGAGGAGEEGDGPIKIYHCCF